MPLVACPVCQGSVSPSAPSCPHCGAPLLQPAARAAPATERPLWEASPSLKVVTIELLAAVLFTIGLSVAVALAFAPLLRFVAGMSRQAALAVTEYRAWARLAAVLFVVVVAGGRLARLLWRALVLRSQRYRLTNQRLLIESGVLSKTINDIDMRTVDDIVMQQSFTERLLGIGRIAILSSEPGARGRGTRVQLLGIAAPREVRETIRDAAYRATGGQLFTRAT